MRQTVYYNICDRCGLKKEGINPPHDWTIVNVKSKSCRESIYVHLCNSCSKKVNEEIGKALEQLKQLIPPNERLYYKDIIVGLINNFLASQNERK